MAFTNFWSDGLFLRTMTPPELQILNSLILPTSSYLMSALIIMSFIIHIAKTVHLILTQCSGVIHKRRADVLTLQEQIDILQLGNVILPVPTEKWDMNRPKCRV